MNTETPPWFETSEMLATFIASTPLLSQSWSLCNHLADMSKNFSTEMIGNVGYVAFSGDQRHVSCSSVDDRNCRNMVPLSWGDCNGGIFSPLVCEDEGGEKEKVPVMVQAGMLRNFLSLYGNGDPNFRNQILELLQKCKCIVTTGHSVGGATASLAALWLLSHLQSISSTISVICITFGSPLLGNESLSRAVLRERWCGCFCHVVSHHDIVPRLLFAPIDPTRPHLLSLSRFSSLSAVSPLESRVYGERDVEVFRAMLAHLEMVAQGEMESLFWPFGNYFFCSEEGGICVDNAMSVIKMMYLLVAASSPMCCVEDHLKYGDYVGKISLQFLEKRGSFQGEIPESSCEAGVALALQSSGISCQEPIANLAKDCLKAARRMGRTPNLNCANLSIKLSKITPYRAEIEWYKSSCDRADDQLGYYDSFKQRGSSKRDSKINMNRHKLAQFWDHVINMFETDELPHDFCRRSKWVNASQFYKLLVEPLEIAEYYRTGMHRTKGHYINHGRERRFQVFDMWWEGRPVSKKEIVIRSKFAGLTQDTCFWARVEEARECLESVRSEKDPGKFAAGMEDLDKFGRYAGGVVERKEVSKDVVARNSSYTLWVKDYEQLKSKAM